MVISFRTETDRLLEAGALCLERGQDMTAESQLAWFGMISIDTFGPMEPLPPTVTYIPWRGRCVLTKRTYLPGIGLIRSQSYNF
jgi:hypothetical protein